jgi:hypothetical protein
LVAWIPLPAVELAEFGDVTSTVVSRRGEIVLEQDTDGDPGALPNSRLCTKTIVASLLGFAIERGAPSRCLGIAASGSEPETDRWIGGQM